MAKDLPNTALTRVVKPIVNGQIMSFLHDHPEIAAAWTGKLANGKSKAQAIRDSLGKRITRDLLCGMSTARLRSALLEISSGASSGDGVEGIAASSGVGVVFGPASITPPRPRVDPRQIDLEECIARKKLNV